MLHVADRNPEIRDQGKLTNDKRFLRGAGRNTDRVAIAAPRLSVLSIGIIVLAALTVGNISGGERMIEETVLPSKVLEKSGLTPTDWLRIKRLVQREVKSAAVIEYVEPNLVADDAASEDSFGVSVSVAGDWVVVGAPWDNVDGHDKAGSAYVFNRNGGEWALFEKLSAEPLAAEDNFGFSVAVARWSRYAVVAVGAPRRHTDTGVGRAFVYYCDATEPGPSCQLHRTLLGNDTGDRFGYSVATNYDAVAVGAPYDDHAGGLEAGSVLYYDLGSDIFFEITASDAEDEDTFGMSVSMSGAKLLVGAPGDVNFSVRGGSVYYYQCDLVCVFVQNFAGNDTSEDDFFGWSVATSYDLAVVGAPGAEVDGYNQAGAAYVFILQVSNPYWTWTQLQKLVADDYDSLGHFGEAVSLQVWPEPQRIAVGAPFTDQAGVGAGTAYVFSPSPTSGDWVQTHAFQYADAASWDVFGISIDISDDTLVVGSGGDDRGVLENAGSAFVLTLPLFACDFETGNTSDWSGTIP